MAYDMYIVSTDPEAMGNPMAEGILAEQEALAGIARSGRPMDPERARVAVLWLAGALAKAGFEISSRWRNTAIAATETKPVLNARKMAWFEKNFEALRERLEPPNAKLAFATDALHAAELRNLVDDASAHMVWLDTGHGGLPYTLDGFVRRIEPGLTYYVHDEMIRLND